MSKVLLISTGGTITMVRDAATRALVPADMETFKAFMPELFAGEVEVDIQAFSPLIDSSDINPACWVRMAQKNLPGGKKTLKAYYWMVCGAEYDQEHA